MRRLIFLLLLSPLLLGMKPIGLTRKAAATAAGPNTWYDVETSANANANLAGDTNAIRWAVVTVAQAGTSTQFRVYQRSQFGGSEVVKVALYNGTALIAQGTVSFTGAGVPVYRTANWASSVAVVAQNYNLMISYVGGNGEAGFNNATATYSTNNATSYASAPPATLPSATSTPAGKPAMGIFVQ